MAVFALDKRHKPLMPRSEKRARLLLARVRAVVQRGDRFTIRLKDRMRAKVGRGARAGIHMGRVAVCARGSFKPDNADTTNAKSCKLLHRADGYGYGWQPALCLRD